MQLPDRNEWMLMSPMLDDLLELGEASRRQKLRELEDAGSGTLAARLQALLNAAQQAGTNNFLCADLQSRGVGLPSLVGASIGPFEVERYLGGGGTGSVWQASHRDGLVALKLLHMSLVGHAAAQRFRREGAILARLDHPAIAKFVGAGVTAFGQPYLALELVDGVPIDEHCLQGCLPNARRLQLFGELLDAVAYAHNRGVIHRDIKPGNVLVTREGQVKLLDFGIAKIGSAGAYGPTTTGAPAMTPYYAAPEQLRSENVTAGADVFALGLLLFELVSGYDPFLRGVPGKGYARTGEAASLRTIWGELSRDLDRLRRACDERNTSPEQMRADFMALDDVLRAALCVDASSRLADAGTFAKRLRAVAARG